MGACNEFSTCIHVKSEARLLFGIKEGRFGVHKPRSGFGSPSYIVGYQFGDWIHSMGSPSYQTQIQTE
jgi:hypothetical protein